MRDLVERALAEQVGAGVADVRQCHLVAGAEEGGDRGAHALELRAVVDLRLDLGVRGGDAPAQVLGGVVAAVALPSRVTIVPMAMELAMSPPAWPPIPSATTRRCGPAYPSPGSPSGPDPHRSGQRSRARSSWGPGVGSARGQFCRCAARCRPRPHGCGEALRPEEGAVGGAEVLDVPRALALEDAGVATEAKSSSSTSALSGLRPMRVPDSRSGRLVPLSGPSVTVSDRGVRLLRRGRLDAGSLGARWLRGCARPGGAGSG